MGLGVIMWVWRNQLSNMFVGSVGMRRGNGLGNVRIVVIGIRLMR